MSWSDLRMWVTCMLDWGQTGVRLRMLRFLALYFISLPLLLTSFLSLEFVGCLILWQAFRITR